MIHRSYTHVKSNSIYKINLAKTAPVSDIDVSRYWEGRWSKFNDAKIKLNDCFNYSLEQEIQNLVEQAEQLVEVEPEAGDEGGSAASASGSASADEAGT